MHLICENSYQRILFYLIQSESSCFHTTNTKAQKNCSVSLTQTTPLFLFFLYFFYVNSISRKMRINNHLWRKQEPISRTTCQSTRPGEHRSSMPSHIMPSSISQQETLQIEFQHTCVWSSFQSFKHSPLSLGRWSDCSCLSWISKFTLNSVTEAS